MISINNFRKLSFLVYGVGSTGKSVIKFFKRNKITNFKVWDDKDEKSYKLKRPISLDRSLREVDYVILSPGVSLHNSRNKKKLIKHKSKIITDIDLVFLLKRFYKSIVVTGTNGKSTTCKIIEHVLKKNKYKISLGGNIGIPILNLKIKKNSILLIEASSFQLAYSKFIKPDFAILLNITNDHLDWHGNMKNYINSKFKIFENQTKNQYSLINKELELKLKKKKFKGKLISPKILNYKKFKSKINNSYIKLNINDENMNFVFALAKLFKVSNKSLFNSLKTFIGLPHRYEIFLKKKNCVFINDSKATSFQSTRFALKNSKNIFWIVGGLPKKNDKIILNDLKKNIIKSYIIGKNTNFFKKQLRSEINYHVKGNLKNSIIHILKDIKSYSRENNTILLSPSAASFDQYLNFEKRGDEFKKLSKLYARKYI